MKRASCFPTLCRTAQGRGDREVTSDRLPQIGPRGIDPAAMLLEWSETIYALRADRLMRHARADIPQSQTARARGAHADRSTETNPRRRGHGRAMPQIGAPNMATAKSKTPSKSASKSKSTAPKQTAPKQTPKPKQRQTLAKMPTAKERAEMKKQNRRAVAIKYADGHTLIRSRPIEPVAYGRGGGVQVDAEAAVADAASAMACVDADGKPIGRARISTPKIAQVRAAMTKTKTTAHTLVGAKSAKQSLTELRAVALKRSPLTGDTKTALGALAKTIGDPKVHKMNGRALAAAVVAITDAK